MHRSTTYNAERASSRLAPDILPALQPGHWIVTCSGSWVGSTTSPGELVSGGLEAAVNEGSFSREQRR